MWARAIWNEMNQTGCDRVFLDVSRLPDPAVRFPNIYQTCLGFGYDLTRDPIPVAPAAHFMMGGVKTNTYGETSIYGLYACGEVACNGVHGANRLASNSLLEGLVFGQRIVEASRPMVYRRTVGVKEIMENCRKEDNLYLPEGEREPAEIRRALSNIMWEYVGIIRDEEGLKTAAGAINKLGEWARAQRLILSRINMRQCPGGWSRQLCAQGSRGAHYRRDYPAPDDIRWAKHLNLKTGRRVLDYELDANR